MSYGGRIRTLRLERGLKAKYVAEKIGLCEPVATSSTIERAYG